MDNATHLFRIKKTCLSMLKQRGYLIASDEFDIDREQFREKHGDNINREDMTILVPLQDDPTQQIFVFFPDEEKIGVKTIETYAQRMQAEGVPHAILVIPQAMTAFAKNAVALFEQNMGYRIEQFTDNEMKVNILEHVLVPDHRILADDEKKVLLDRYKVKDSQLPRIQFTDPVARFLGMQKGQVVRIVRPSETAGRYVTYRLCV
jgi:DNA-directed RNA polymerases I, II, and III subunit RPABC1